MINSDVEIFLSVTGRAFMRALESGDPHKMHNVIQNARQVIEEQEKKAFDASLQTTIDEYNKKAQD